MQSGGALAVPRAPTDPDVGATHRPISSTDLDGLLLQGGADVCPRTYGEEPLRPEWEGDEIRDRYEIELIHAFHAAGKPVLGICRGAQILNVAFGGTLYQDIATQVDTDLVHRNRELYDDNRHQVDLVDGLRRSPTSTPAARGVTINSVHHQAVKDLGDGLSSRPARRPTASSRRCGSRRDGSTAAVQWHPEFMPVGDAASRDALGRPRSDAPGRVRERHRLRAREGPRTRRPACAVAERADDTPADRREVRRGPRRAAGVGGAAARRARSRSCGRFRGSS